VENIPGTISISGSEFADKLTEQAMNLGADVELENVVAVEDKGGVKLVTTEEGSTYEGKTVILAVGVKHRMLGLPGEHDLVGKGLSFCAVCDGAFYAGQDTVMIGGGNSALQEALLLSEVCRKVTVVQNLAFFTGEKKLADALQTKENVEVLFNHLVTGYTQADGMLTGVEVKNSETGEVKTIAADGVFLAVGLVPENGAFESLAQLDGRGYFAAGESCTTATPGVFVAGDCRAKEIRQVTTAAGDGAVAAMAACRFLDQH
jgi:thioredoxin reductase (NADPH)